MIVMRARLTNLAHATHEQTKTVEQYMEKNKEWLASDDWKSARGNIGQARESLTRLQHNLTPTRMERLIDEMSEQVLDDFEDKELIKNIDVDGRSHIKMCKETSALLSRREFF